MKVKVLIVEDDADLGNLLKQYLELNNFHVYRVYNGQEAREQLQIEVYDILIVDVMMPKEDGFTLAGKLKQHYPEIPFLFVTARKMKEDVLKGLKLGADDYIIKPFDADELILRMQNILKRTWFKQDQKADIIQIGVYKFDLNRLLLSSPTMDRILTEKEAKLLHYLWQHHDQLIKRQDILEHLWGESDFFNGRSLDVFITRLRKHFVEDSNVQIESVRGIGFRFYH